MKSLSQFKPVVDALTQIAMKASIEHGNGTQGKEYECSFWDHEDVYDKGRNEISIKIGRALLVGDTATAILLREQLEVLPASKKTLIFKMVDPIRRLQGTKIMHDSAGKAFSPAMSDVTLIHIPQDVVDMDALEFEESTDMLEDKHGNPTPIIRLRLTKCMLDVKEETRNWKGEETRGKRANATILSYRSLQTVGLVLNIDQKKDRRVIGMDELI